jgi:hypothetical protein
VRMQLFKLANSSGHECVASRSSGGARPASSASFQPVTQTHHRSPSFRPGKLERGVMRSLPRESEKLSNSSDIRAQIVCSPPSPKPVRQ